MVTRLVHEDEEEGLWALPANIAEAPRWEYGGF